MALAQMSSASKNRRIGSSYSSKVCTIIASLAHLTLLHHILLFLLAAMTMPTPAESLLPAKMISITNNHTKLLTVRCFTFYDEDSPRTRRMHLQPNQSYSFVVEPHRLYPSATMYNCSTNMGVFVAYRYDYSCSLNTDPQNACEWMFDEKQTYYKSANGEWKIVDYHPNYESLGRGGVVKGYFTN